MAVVDGHYYADGAEPNLGSIECTEVIDQQDGTETRNYQLMAADIEKLPSYDDLAAGSCALVLDTGDLYIYRKGADVWVKFE